MCVCLIIKLLSVVVIARAATPGGVWVPLQYPDLPSLPPQSVPNPLVPHHSVIIIAQAILTPVHQLAIVLILINFTESRPCLVFGRFLWLSLKLLLQIPSHHIPSLPPLPDLSPAVFPGPSGGPPFCTWLPWLSRRRCESHSHPRHCHTAWTALQERWQLAHCMM